MAADYNKPVTTDNYADILTQLRDNIAAAQNMLNDLTGVTNIPTDALRYDQTAKKFQIYNGTTFVDTVLSEAGGGTGTTGLGDYAFLSPTESSFSPVAKVGGTEPASYTTRAGTIIDVSSNLKYVEIFLSFTSPKKGVFVIELPFAPATSPVLGCILTIGPAISDVYAYAGDFGGGSYLVRFRDADTLLTELNSGASVEVAISGMIPY